MSREVLKVTARDASGKSPVARRLRKTGRVPGVLNKSGESAAFSVDALEIAAVLRHGTTVIDVDLDGSVHTSVVKEYQVHPVRGNLVHIDMQEVSMDERIKSTVSITLVGSAPGVRAGGILSQPVHELNIESTPLNIPETIEVDISSVEMGESLHLESVTAPDGVIFLDDLEATLINITKPRTAAADAADLGDAAPDAEGAEGAAAPAAEGGEAAAGDGE